MIFKKLNAKLDMLLKEQRENNKDVDKRLDNLEKVAIVQENNLQTHMRRSDHLEELVKMEMSKRENTDKKIDKHINMVEGGLKLLGIIALLVTIIGGIAKIFGVI